ncbi:MAG: NADH dehydrogenase (quinone) subunit D [Acidobacteriia bacterium]|nr:NADH dehydrogenase (quinone) subunit D [Terriglobia bacterium]
MESTRFNLESEQVESIAGKSETMVLSMGPQHPSTHGVLRVVLELDGETVVKARPDIGYLHTGMEKLAESKTYAQVLPITDRTDYLAPMSNNLGYIMAVEKLCGLQNEIPPRAQFLRVLIVELNRIASHLVWLGTHALDLGAMTVFLYCFREREQILNFFEMVCGGRLTTSYFRVGGLPNEVPKDFIPRVQKFIQEFPDRVNEYEGLLTKNPIWKGRTKGVAQISAEDAIGIGLSGPSLRASGVDYDIRKREPYCGYEKFDFQVPVRTEGDVYARYLCRVQELRESTRIVQQAIDGMPEGPIRADCPKYVLPDRNKMKTEMETLIHHYKIITEGIHPPVGEVYFAIENPKGELGYYLVSDGGPKPFRFHIRGPSFVNLQALAKMCEGRLVADVVAAIGSIDIVLGEVDR